MPTAVDLPESGDRAYFSSTLPGSIWSKGLVRTRVSRVVMKGQGFAQARTDDERSEMRFHE